MDFTVHPSTGDLSTVKKTTAISRSIKNLLSTKINERLFQPGIDNGIEILLIENFNKLTSNRLEQAIKKTIDKLLPRALVENITVKADEESNAYLVSITYVPDNDVQEANLEVFLERT